MVSTDAITVMSDVLFAIIGILLFFIVAGYIINGVCGSKLIRACGMPGSGMAWLPLPGALNNAICYCTGVPAIRAQSWLLLILRTGVTIALFTPLGKGTYCGWVWYTVCIYAYVLTIVAVITVSRRCKRPIMAPILCYMLIPWIGPAVCTLLLRYRY